MILLVAALVLAIFNTVRHVATNDLSWGLWLNAAVIAFVVLVLVFAPPDRKR